MATLTSCSKSYKGSRLNIVGLNRKIIGVISYHGLILAPNFGNLIEIHRGRITKVKDFLVVFSG